MIKAKVVATVARDWIGVPFRHQGRTRQGVDCIGFVVALLRETSILPTTFKDDPAYGRMPTSSTFIDTLEKYCTKIDKIETGCVIAIKWTAFKYPSHIAVIDERGYMVHAYETKKKVITHGYGEPWIRMTHGIYRLPGVVQ